MYLLPGGFFVKLRLFPWVKENDSWIWLVSFAVSKSKRQVNDWLQQRKNKRFYKLSTNLTGKFGPLTQAIAVRQMREWFNELPKGDVLFFRCESFVPDKQFRVWQKWFMLHESKDWIINQEHKYFLRCK